MSARAEGALRQALEAGFRAHDEGRLEEAERLLAQAVELEPRSVAAHAGLGQVRIDRARHAEALAAFETAARLQPSARTFNNVGIALMALGRNDEAIRLFESALQSDPRYALASFNLARLLAARDDGRAFGHAQAAVQSDASNADAWLLMSDLLRRRHDYDNAMRAVNLAIEKSPSRPIGWTARAKLLAEVVDNRTANEEYSAAAKRFPHDVRAALGAGLTLPHVYESHQHLESSRAAYAQGLERLLEAAPRFVFRDAETALAETRWTNFYLAYQGRDDRALQERYGEFQRDVLERSAPQLFSPRKPPAALSRVRVGFLSHYFYNCVVGRYFASWILRLDPARFERIVYYTNAWVGDDTRAIMACADRFRHLAGDPLTAIARQVIDDELDILVYPEVGMHPDIASFAALRLAPVQAMAWGHPTTCGSREMDWYLSCAEMESPRAPVQYRERLALLPGLGTHYTMPSLEGDPRREEFGLPADRTLYLAPQSLFKMHPDNDSLIAGVLAADPSGSVVMFEATHARSTATFRARLGASLESHGVDPNRVIMLKPNLQHAAYLRLNAVCDVMLDCVHWSGGNTSIDAIAAGLPLVTLPGELMRGRQSAAMLRAIGLEECIASDPAQYVTLAVALGNDPERRRRLSEVSRKNRGLLFARDEPIRALEDFLERAARG